MAQDAQNQNDSDGTDGVGLLPTKLLPLILDGMSEAMVVIDSDLIIRDYNSVAESLFGYPRSVVIGRRFSVLDRPMVLGDGDELAPENFPAMQALRTGEPTARTLIGLTDSESRVQWMRVCAIPWRETGGEGAPTHVVVLYENVTARLEAEAQAALHSQVIGQAADSIMIIDSRGLVLEVNPAFSRLTGFGAGDIVGGSLRIIEFRDGDRAVFGQMIEALQRGEIWSNRIIHRRRDGSSVDCIGTLSPLYSPNGALNGFVYMLRDMSRIADMERRMMSSQKMEAIGTLAGGIAHDFNNLLHSISGYVELSLRDVAGTRAARYLESALGACERAEGLVRQILTFSRREDRARHPVLLRHELEKAVDFVRITLPASVEITTELNCDDAAVLGDPTEICQVVINLLTNAYQALPGSAGRIGLTAGTIEITETNRGAKSNLTFGPYAQIVVTDTGKGIPPQIIERIFEPFFTTKPVNEGTGMGLSIVHGVVTSMQGDITVESHVGSGTRFSILLPLTRAPSHSSRVADLARPERGSERVLLVDDEGNITSMVSEMLSGLGYTVTVCNSGESALELVRSNAGAYDIVITDQNMPRLTGVRLAALVHGIRPSLPVLLCTGNADKELMDKAEAAGVSHILHKPLRLTAMAGIIRSTLDRWERKITTPSPFPA